MPIAVAFLVVGVPPLLVWLFKPAWLARDQLAAYFFGAVFALIGVLLVQ